LTERIILVSLIKKINHCRHGKKNYNRPLKNYFTFCRKSSLLELTEKTVIKIKSEVSIVYITNVNRKITPHQLKNLSKMDRK